MKIVANSVVYEPNAGANIKGNGKE